MNSDTSLNQYDYTYINCVDDELMSDLIDNTLIHKVIHQNANNDDYNVYCHDDMKNVRVEDFMRHYDKYGKKYLANELQKHEIYKQNEKDELFDISINETLTNSQSSIISSTSNQDSDSDYSIELPLPNICCYCGVKEHRHLTKRHMFIRICEEYRCIKCGLFFFEHHTKKNKCTFLPFSYIKG